MSAAYTSQLCSIISRLTQRSCLSCRSWKWQYAHARVRVCVCVCVCEGGGGKGRAHARLRAFYNIVV